MISAIYRTQPVYDRRQKFKGSHQDHGQAVPAEEDMPEQSAIVDTAAAEGALTGPGYDQPAPDQPDRPDHRGQMAGEAISGRLHGAEQLEFAEHPELKLGKIVSLVSHLARGFGLGSFLPADAPIETNDSKVSRKANLPKSAYPKETSAYDILA